MQDIWLYVFSVIPQTLGIVVALVATFSIFKISKIYELLEKRVENTKDYLYPLFPEKELHQIEDLDHNDVINMLVETLNTGKIDKNSSSYPAYDKLKTLLNNEIHARNRYFEVTPERIYAYLTQRKNFLIKLALQRKSTLNAITRSFILNTILIVISLFLIPAYSKFSCEITTRLVILMIIASVSSLILTIYDAWLISRF